MQTIGKKNLNTNIPELQEALEVSELGFEMHKKLQYFKYNDTTLPRNREPSMTLANIKCGANETKNSLC